MAALAAVLASFAHAASRVAVLPFTVNSEQDLAFLQNGVRDMLITRLTQPEKVILIDRSAVDAAMADAPSVDENVVPAIGAALKADYVVFGSITVFGNSVSTDARIFDTARKESVLAFNETGRDNGDIIEHIDRFAASVNEKVFGGKADQTPTAARTAPPAEESRKHPEAVWRDASGRMFEDEGPVDAEGGRAPLGQIWKSRNFKAEIRAMAAGDADGDGLNEVVFMDNKTVWVYRVVEGRFIQVGEFEGGVHDKFLAVDVADINGNGRAEIFVSNLHENTKVLSSFVLEWDDQAFQPILDRERWYYRVIRTPESTPMLVGQKHTRNDLFIAGIDEMAWQGDTYVSTRPLALPGWVNVFGFGYAASAPSGPPATVAFSPNEELRVLSADGESVWESPDSLGGNTIYLDKPDEASSSIGSYQETKRTYLPLRVWVTDLEKDGKHEVIVAKNKDSTRRMLSRIRVFTGGQIECYGWDQLGLYRKWTTREVSGQISDYAVADFNNDGKMELVFSVLQSTDSMISRPRSYIAAYDLNAVTIAGETVTEE